MLKNNPLKKCNGDKINILLPLNILLLLKNNSLKKFNCNKINILFMCHQQEREFIIVLWLRLCYAISLGEKFPVLFSGRKNQNSLENFEGLESSKKWLTFLSKNYNLAKDIGNKINILFTWHQKEREFMHYSLIIIAWSGNLIKPFFDLS